jgi:pimeloyl-ACP methyl ester carboxylesterase
MHQPNDVAFATVHLATGLRLYYAERGNPTGEAIIFLHGYSDSWFSCGWVLSLLSPEYHAFALDQHGHGAQISPNAATPWTTSPPTSTRS